MSAGRFVAPGRTRSCPHCKAIILDSAAVCPGCHHHLRFDSASGQRPQTADTPLRVDGILRHTADGGAWEYSIVLAIRNGRGEEISRQVVGVGALQPAEERTFSLAVEVFKPLEAGKSAEAPKLQTAAGAAAAAVPAHPAVPTHPAAPAHAAAPATATANHISATTGAPASARAPAPPSTPASSRPPAATGAPMTRPPEPRVPVPPGRGAPPGLSPPGLGRDPVRPQPSPTRSAGVKDPRFAASDPIRQPKRP